MGMADAMSPAYFNQFLDKVDAHCDALRKTSECVGKDAACTAKDSHYQNFILIMAGVCKCPCGRVFIGGMMNPAEGGDAGGGDQMAMLCNMFKPGKGMPSGAGDC